MTSGPATLVWFRQDLRLQDNPALREAISCGSIIPLYILDDTNSGEAAMGSASRWWLHQSLRALSHSLGGRLLVASGDPLHLIPALVSRLKIKAVRWNRCYEPWQIARDQRLKSSLADSGVQASSFNGSLLREPWQILKKDGSPYRMFTPYWHACLQAFEPEQPVATQAFSPAELIPRELLRDSLLPSGNEGIDALGLLPRIRWDAGLAETWEPGEQSALKRLEHFLTQGLQGYRGGRDYPALPHCSRLSPHLHFGEISPRQVWHLAHRYAIGERLENDLAHFHRELGWREFSNYLLYHQPAIVSENIQPRFDRFPWSPNAEYLSAWQQGRTGIPIVDAGMRELWQTGYMHNRVRMVAGSFLVKNLLQHWREGLRWFHDCLVDADLASNSASWQWVAGSGVDAAPYFRIFNPVTQSQKFDAQGDYIRRFIPELSRLPGKHIHAPSLAPRAVLEMAGVSPGVTYPLPIVDLKESRNAALDAYRSAVAMSGG